jgi:hypothetical protein
MSEYNPEPPETETVELEMWMWKQILGKLKHDKQNSITKEGEKDTEHILMAIEHQIDD